MGRALSAGTRHQITRFEASRGLPPLAVEDALRRWGAFLGAVGWPLYLPEPHLPGLDLWDDRELIERAITALGRRAGRDLARVVAPLDADFLARTLPNPCAPMAWPWWRRRCHDLGKILQVPSQAP
ncbi:hypothetical protein AB0M46_16900 [Dactylosporangium sp. NPDC051485]|uniref:hypothetical protein n=1 Tax=Dactylosporangium sp. NPDC051485 TaxID=3154846 RepID=UPI003449A433